MTDDRIKAAEKVGFKAFMSANGLWYAAREDAGGFHRQGVGRHESPQHALAAVAASLHTVKNYQATGTHDEYLGEVDEATYHRYMDEVHGGVAPEVGAVDGADYGFPGHTIYIED